MITENAKPTRELITNAREAADILCDVSRAYFDEATQRSAGGVGNMAWCPDSLNAVAHNWEAELDAAEAAANEVIEQLTQCLAGFFTQSTQYERVARERATPIAYLIHANFDIKPKGGRG